MNTTAQIITIGDELLYGKTQNSNTQWISMQLDFIGIKVVQQLTIGDTEKDILAALKYTENKSSIILITGGLGSTTDDVTKPCLTKYFGVEMQINKKAFANIKTMFKRLKVETTLGNQSQAYLPTNCEMIPNSFGTASGMWFYENKTTFISMPGVPFEMKEMMSKFILPKLKNKFDLPIIYHKTIKTIGIGESQLAKIIKPWEEALPTRIKLSYLPTLAEVELCLTSLNKSFKQVEIDIEKQTTALKKYAGKYIFGYDTDTIESVFAQLLVDKKESVSIAESCTGGYLSHIITSLPGSSVYFKGSIIAYTNEIKTEKIAVKKTTLEQYGSVSEQTIAEMAAGVRIKFNTTYGIATSGIAGPSGGTLEKPVGTIWIAFATPLTVHTKLLSLVKDRIFNIQHSSKLALAFAWQTLTKSE